MGEKSRGGMRLAARFAFGSVVWGLMGGGESEPASCGGVLAALLSSDMCVDDIVVKRGDYDVRHVLCGFP